MRRSKEQIDKLEQALARAHSLHEPPRFSHQWFESIMHEIRQQAVSIAPLPEVSRLVWRAAAVVVLVSALFVGSVLTWNAGRADVDFSAILAEATVYPTLIPGAP